MVQSNLLPISPPSTPYTDRSASNKIIPISAWGVWLSDSWKLKQYNIKDGNNNTENKNNNNKRC